MVPGPEVSGAQNLPPPPPLRLFTGERGSSQTLAPGGVIRADLAMLPAVKGGVRGRETGVISGSLSGQGRSQEPGDGGRSGWFNSWRYIQGKVDTRLTF